MSEATTSPPFYIHVRSSFDGVIRSLNDLANMPRLSGNQVNLGVILNSQMRNADLLTANEAVNTLGWTTEQYNLAYGRRGFRAIQEAWSGAAYDPTRRWLICNGAGHAASGFNSVHPFDLNQIGNTAADMWPRIINPSRYARGLTSPYEDGTPPASHTYGHCTYDATLDAFVEPSKGVYSPEDGDDGPGARGLFAWLPLANLTADPEANLAAWETYFPSGDPEAGAADSIGYENAWAEYDSVSGLVIGSGPSRNLRAVIDYQSKTNDWTTLGSGKATTKARSFSTINETTREVWTFGHNTFGTGTGMVTGPVQMQVVDISDLLNSAPGALVEVTGDAPVINGLNGFQSGDDPSSIAQRSDMFCTLTYAKPYNGAIYWFPLYSDKTYTRDGVALTEAQKKATGRILTLIRDDRTALNLEIIENGAAKMPVWVTSAGVQDSCSGGPYDRFRYIPEFDVILYVHSWASDALVLKLPAV